jgi:DNA-binding transcriptional LysR family regulator
MTDSVEHFKTFVRVVETGSFTAVAVERATTQPTISRQIASLERQLGCVLFNRTTRALALTDDGAVFYQQAHRALEAVAEAEGSVGRRKGKPSGTLRLASAVVFGRLHLVPRLPAFLERYPDVSVDLNLSDGFSDLIEENIDLAIRVGMVTEANLVARRIGTTRRVVVATPGYLKRYGVPQAPEDLAGHSCIVYSRLAAGAQWAFERGGQTVSVKVAGRFHVNSTEGVRAAVLNGVGIGYAPAWHFVDREIERGVLVPLLAEFHPKPQPISAVYPTRRFLAPKVRAMVDYLAADFAIDPLLMLAEGV